RIGIGEFIKLLVAGVLCAQLLQEQLCCLAALGTRFGIQALQHLCARNSWCCSAFRSACRCVTHFLVRLTVIYAQRGVWSGVHSLLDAAIKELLLQGFSIRVAIVYTGNR